MWEFNSKDFTIFIPYKHTSLDDSLKYCLRGIDLYMKGNFNLVVIGDKEDWFSSNIEYIPEKKYSIEKEINLNYNRLLGISSDKCTKNILLMDDDIYILKDCHINLFEIPRYEGELWFNSSKDVSSKLYQKYKNTTIKLLKSHHLPILNYSVHQPYFYKKENFIKLFELYPVLYKEGIVIESLYYNHYFKNNPGIESHYAKDDWKLRVNTKNVNKELFDKHVKNKQLLNNSEQGYYGTVENFLKNKFPNKSKYEI